MSEKDEKTQQAPPGWNNQMPPMGYYGYPPMMPPMHYPGFTQQPTPPDVAQYHAQMHAMAMQQAAHHQTMMGGMHRAPSPEASNQAQQGDPFQDNPMMQQAQAMLDDAMGEEQAGIFKELLGSLGMNDKEFWKGALIGAAATLVLSNENVRKSIMGLVSGAGDMIKTGGASVKDSAVNTASTVKAKVATGEEIFRDTYQAGKEGFKESVERHKPTEDETQAPETE